MIMKNDFNKKSEDFLFQEKIGLDKAVNHLKERYDKSELERDVFLKQNEEFAKRQAELKKRMNKIGRK